MSKEQLLFPNPDTSDFAYKRESFINEMIKNKFTFGIMEGCEGGGLNCMALTIPSAPGALKFGLTPYSWDAKVRAGIPEHLLKTAGEYSNPVAEAMAMLAREAQDTTIGIGVVGEFNLENERNPFHIAYALKGRGVVSQTIALASEKRRLLKQKLFIHVFSNCSLLLNNQPLEKTFKDINASEYLSFEYEMLDAKTDAVVRMLKDKNLTVATMESFTGLAIANAITDIPGSSKIFKAGHLAYDENTKKRWGVPEWIFNTYSIYSPEMALAMARAVRKMNGSDIGIGSTGRMESMDTREDSVTCVGEIAIDREGYKPLIVQIQMKPTHRDKMKIDAVSGTLDLLAYFVKYSLFLSANIPSRNNYQRKYLST